MEIALYYIKLYGKSIYFALNDEVPCEVDSVVYAWTGNYEDALMHEAKLHERHVKDVEIVQMSLLKYLYVLLVKYINKDFDIIKNAKMKLLRKIGKDIQTI